MSKCRAAWLLRLIWLAWGGIIVFAWSDSGAPLRVLVSLVIVSLVWLGFGIWWAKRGGA